MYGFGKETKKENETLSGEWKSIAFTLQKTIHDVYDGAQV